MVSGWEKSIIQIFLSLLENWEKSLNLDMQHYIELIKLIYDVCLVIYLAVSVVWVEFETPKIIDNDVKLKIKKFILTIGLLSCVLILWERNEYLFFLNIKKLTCMKVGFYHKRLIITFRKYFFCREFLENIELKCKKM